MTETDKPKKRKITRLTKAQWAHISGIWELGEMTLAQLSEKFNVAPETISRKMKQFGVKQGSRADTHRQNVQKELEKTDIQRAEQLAIDIQDAKDMYIAQQKALNRLAINEVTQAAKDKRPFAVIDPNLKALERAQKINAATRAELWKIWRLDDVEEHDDDLPDLNIRVLSQSEVDTIKQEQERRGVMGIDELIEGLDTDLDAAIHASEKN